MDKQVPIDSSAIADEHVDGSVHEVAPDIAYQRLAIVNIAFIGAPDAGDGGWVLVDAGMPGTAAMIAGAASRRFGEGARPSAILLTHGHFDHVGALETLAEQWDVPIFAHFLEHPYLDGRSSYPPPDPTVGGGLMAKMSGLFPRGPINVSPRLQALPAGGRVPVLPDWQWIATPGHTPGHISLWRESDRTLIVGDAFVTTKQESAYAATMQRPELHGPPTYYTPDWPTAGASVRKLAQLEPELVVTGHGRAMRGPQMRAALHILARDFEAVAVPKQGRYVGDSAQADDTGVTYIPPKGHH